MAAAKARKHWAGLTLVGQIFSSETRRSELTACHKLISSTLNVNELGNDPERSHPHIVYTTAQVSKPSLNVGKIPGKSLSMRPQGYLRA